MGDYPALRLARDEPEYVDQVVRRQEYEAAHPGVEIRSVRPMWRAVIPGDDGETVIVRHDLRMLLDELESLDAGDRAP